MRCQRCGTVLASTARFCGNCGAPVSTNPSSVNTGGGAFVGGNVSTSQFVGRDQVVEGDYVHGSQSGLAGEDLAVLAASFQQVHAQIAATSARDKDADSEILTGVANRLEEEASKGEDADPDAIKRGLGTLAKLAPDVLEVAVNALTNPGAAVASAVRVAARAFADNTA